MALRYDQELDLNDVDGGNRPLDTRSNLPRNTVLDGSYRIERVIGSGGFGITYEAEDMKLGTRVAIKEYIPTNSGTAMTT